MKPWNNTSYQKINNAEFANDSLLVNFENGDAIKIPKDRLIPFGISDIEWAKLSFSPFEIVIPASPHPFEIPWDSLRVMTDKEFGKYLAERSEEQSLLIGTKIKRLREKKGIKSNELAERAGITPQTISRIEQGHTDVGFATLRKILAAMGYSLKDLANEESVMGMEKVEKSFPFLLKRLSKTGIDTNLLTRKIIPARLQKALNKHTLDSPGMLLDETANYVGSIYGWSLDEIWSNSNLKIKDIPATAYFKKPSNTNINQIKAYSHYAYYLAQIILKINKTKKRDYPEDINEFKTNFIRQYKKIEFENLLHYVWDLGICVLPLNDSGVFHGASWNIEGKHIIILKQNTTSHARWIFDLLHELYHIFRHLQKINTSVIETEELTPFSNDDSIEELEANAFANQVLFGNNQAEVLAEKCVETAQWDLKNLKSAVKRIAKDEKVREDFLSNYLAFRLSNQGENWWSTASKLQINEPNPFVLASNFLKKKIPIEKLSPMDQNLLNTAISN
ncbi:MAG: XRE family transcriptional regulator [Ignavibacteria bacterium]